MTVSWSSAPSPGSKLDSEEGAKSNPGAELSPASPNGATSELTDSGRCTASSSLLLVELQHGTSKLRSLGDRQRIGALLCLLLLLLALLCRMNAGLISTAHRAAATSPCRHSCSSARSKWTAARAAFLLVSSGLELLVLDTELCLPALQFELSNFCALLLERKCSKEASALALLKLDAHLLNLEPKALVARLRLDEGEVELKGWHVHHRSSYLLGAFLAVLDGQVFLTRGFAGSAPFLAPVDSAGHPREGSTSGLTHS